MKAMVVDLSSSLDYSTLDVMISSITKRALQVWETIHGYIRSVPPRTVYQ